MTTGRINQISHTIFYSFLSLSPSLFLTREREKEKHTYTYVCMHMRAHTHTHTRAALLSFFPFITNFDHPFGSLSLGCLTQSIDQSSPRILSFAHFIIPLLQHVLICVCVSITNNQKRLSYNMHTTSHFGF